MTKVDNMVTNLKSRISDISNRSFRTNHRLAQLLAAEGVLFTLIITLAHNNNNLFASRLGASSSDLGLIASLPPIVGMLSLIPFAIITDRMHNKKPMVMLSAVGLGIMYILVGMTAFLDSNRVPVLIGLLVIVNVPMSLYNSSWQAFFSDICLPVDRNLVYTYRTRMNTAVGIFIPLVAGSILTAVSGSDKILVHQIYYWLAFPLAIGQVLILKKINGGNATDVNHVRLSDVRDSAKSMLHNKMFLGFLGVAILVYCGWEMDWSLYFLAQFKFLPLNESQMSLIAVLGAATQFVTLGLWSRLISKKGVRFVFVIGVSGFALSSVVMFISIILPSSIRLPFYYVFQSIAASTYSAFLLSPLLCLLETLPQKNRAISIAIYNTVILATNVIMPYVGVLLYNNLGQSVRGILISFFVIAVVRILSTGASYVRWRRLRGEETAFD